MANSTVKTVGIVLIVIIIAMFALRVTPFVMAPFGIVSNVFNRVETSLDNGLHVWSKGFFGFPFIPLFSVLMLVFWIIVIIWVYRDAEKRGMNGVLWAILAFIGNLIGLLIYLIVRSDNPLIPEKSTEYYICSSCKKPINKGYKFCPHCGDTLEDNCPNCNKTVQEEWKTCPHCGQNLKKE